MLTEVISWGLKPRVVTGDAWYSGLMNLKHVRKSELDFLFGIENDRLISLEKGTYIKVQDMPEFPDEGKNVYLKEYLMAKPQFPIILIIGNCAFVLVCNICFLELMFRWCQNLV